MLFLNNRSKVAVTLFLCVFACVVFIPSLAFGAEPGAVERAITWAEANPILAAALIGIIWPAITGVASLGYHRFEERFPNFVKALRASGLDLPKTARAVFDMFWPKRLPPLPVLPLVMALFAASLLACGPAQHPCVTAYEKARTEAEIAEVDATCGHLLEGGGGSGGSR